MASLTPERWRQASSYVEEGLSLSGHERSAWVASLREKNPELAALVETLLDEHRVLSEEGFLERGRPLPPLPQAVAGDIVGAYRLLAPIGYGGMGTVWLGERSDGRFERRVAVKFPRIGVAGQSGEERFQREGSLLGRLAHPNIAELVDAGVSSRGQPFLVLEYVDGEPIDRYCNDHRLGAEQRIRLFLEVLSAVAHAHSNLIVHRDLKPSNVLVRNRGQVKLLDFGIAKLLEEQGQASEATLLTQEGGPALTPAYAAPEQITGAPVTTATDVYSLGVLLYLLLSGRHPAGPQAHSPAELIRAIVETEPPPLSQARNLEVNASFATPGSHTVAPGMVPRSFRADLDTILSKALKKDPRERYASVSALANDLERYLHDEPITARPDSAMYRAAKFARRNRTAVALATLALLAIIAGMTGTLMLARKARRERDLAVRERDRAGRITDFMTGMFKVSDPSENAHQDVSAREILDRGLVNINRGLAGDPALQAQMMHVMGNVYSNLGLYDQAQSLLERAIRVSRAAAGPSDPETLSSMDSLGTVLAQQGRFAEAETIQREALDVQRRILGPEQADTLTTMSDLAATLAQEGHLEEAEKLGREVLDKQRRVLGVDDHHTIATMDNLAATLGVEGRLAESEQLERKTIEVERRVYGPDHLGVLNSMSNLADTLYFMGRYAEAGQWWRQTLAIQRRVLGPNHPETARSIYNLGCLAAREGKREEAFRLLGPAIDHLSPRTVPKVDNDPELRLLQSDPRFPGLVARARRRVVTEARCPL